MYSKTLLAIVQDALESMESDSVSSIHDTGESTQVANIAKQTYEYMASVYDWPHQNQFNSLEGLSDSNYPNYLKIPQDVSEVMWFKYRGEKVSYLDPERFVELSDSRRAAYDDGDTRIERVTTPQGLYLYIRNDKDPTYWTSFDNEHLVTDSYDNTQDSTLHEENTSAHVTKLPTFNLSNTFVPDLPDNLVGLFQSEVNAACHLYIRQQQSPVDQKRSLVGRSKMKTKSNRLKQPTQRGRGFGRK